MCHGLVWNWCGIIARCRDPSRDLGRIEVGIVYHLANGSEGHVQRADLYITISTRTMIFCPG